MNKSLPGQFENYLSKVLKVSKKTLRNYRADLKHFFEWAKEDFKEKKILNFNDTEAIIPYLTSELLISYKDFNLASSQPVATINRRLSTLRTFFRFLEFKGLISSASQFSIANIQQAEKIKTAKDFLDDFEKHLIQTGASKITIKNYISDVRVFFEWEKRLKEDQN